MRKLLAGILFLTLMASPSQVMAQSITFSGFNFNAIKDKVKPNPEVTEAVKKSSVSIFNVGDGLGFCSGVIVKITDQSTYVVTNKHCLNATEETLVDNYKVSAVFAPTDDDFALLIVKTDIRGKVAAKLAETDPYTKDKIVHVGYPVFEEFVSWGTVVRETDDWLWAKLKSKGGCSGGGVYNEDKKLVGILWGGLRGENISIFEPVSDLKRFIKKADVFLKDDLGSVY